MDFGLGKQIQERCQQGLCLWQKSRQRGLLVAPTCVRTGKSARSLAKQLFQASMVNGAKRAKVVTGNVLVNFMDGGVAHPNFNHFASCGRDEATV